MSATAEPLSQLSPFAQTWEAYTRAGYCVIPAIPSDKVPGEFRGPLDTGSWTTMSGWNDYSRQAPHPSMFQRWKTWPNANIGIVLGGDVGGLQIVAIDLDSDREDELALLAASLPVSPMRKRGARGWTAFYRAAKSVHTKRYPVPDPTPDKPNKQRMLLEILTGNQPRQTVVPPSMHPNGMSYAFLDGGGIVPANQLPILTQDHLDRLEDNAAHLGWNANVASVRDHAIGSPEDDQNVWRQTNDAALLNIGAWFPALGLPKTRNRGANGWEAIAEWRDSNNGAPTMQRKPNLKLHNTGIVDFGGEKHTALDVVCAARPDVSFDEAFRWLRKRLCLDDDGPDDLPEKPRKIIRAADGTLSDGETGEVIGGANDNSPSLPEAFPDALTRPPGLLGEMIEYVLATAPRPSRALALAAALPVLGTLMGRRDATPTVSGTHLFVVALAATGAGKQHPQDAGSAMLAAATKLRGDHLGGPADVMSQTAIVREVERRPLSCGFVDEFGDLVAKMNARNAGTHETGIKKVLLQLWGKSFTPWTTPSWAGGGSSQVQSPAFSMFGASTPNKFYDALSGDDRENGFLNRFLLIAELARGSNVDPEYNFRCVPEELVDKLRAVYQIDRPMNEDAADEPYIRLVNWANDGSKLIYDTYRDECDGRGHYYTRSAEMATRIATIVAVGCNVEMPEVDVAAITYGIAVTRWSAAHMQSQASDLISDTPVGRERAKIIRKLQQEGGRVAQSDVLKHLGFSSKVLSEHVRDLGPDGTGEITVEEVSAAGGGRARRYLCLAASPL